MMTSPVVFAKYRRRPADAHQFPHCLRDNFAATLDPTLVASPGGFPLIEGGKIIGAIGCSGATGDRDAVAYKAGADSVK
jgi:uncharacterized protein GlcG (DUF336 family)